MKANVGAGLTLAEMKSVLRTLWAREGMAAALMIGPPGIGKSSIVMQLAREIGWTCEVVVASLREPSDLAGLPWLVGGEVRLAAPAWARRLAAAKEGAVLFLDEVNTAAPAVQAALLRVVLDRVVGECELGRQVRIVAAMNESADAANGWELAPAFANRFYHFRVRGPEVKEWAGHLKGTDVDLAVAQPVVDETTFANQFAALVELSAEAGIDLGKGRPGAEVGAFPTPRSWEMALRAAALARATNAGAWVERECAQAAVGVGEWEAWQAAVEAISDVGELPKDASPDRVRRRIERALVMVESGQWKADAVWEVAKRGLDIGQAAVVHTTIGALKNRIMGKLPETKLMRQTMLRLKEFQDPKLEQLRQREVAAGKHEDDIPFMLAELERAAWESFRSGRP